MTLSRSLKQKKCRVCHCSFTPKRAIQPACSLECECVLAVAKVEANKRKRAAAERVADRVKRASLKTIAQLIAEAQTAFNAFIRARDKDKGCFVCLRPFDQNVPGRTLHAGHVRTRGAAGHLRYTEDNCMGECEGCNGPRGAKPHQIKAGAIARIGAARFEELENDNTPHKWTREELIAIKDEYRAKLKALKEQA
jgi:5-methylcytosine-specific restriction endonuclease McrA